MKISSLAAEIPCEWKFATKFASDCECDGLVHSALEWGAHSKVREMQNNKVQGTSRKNSSSLSHCPREILCSRLIFHAARISFYAIWCRKKAKMRKGKNLGCFRRLYSQKFAQTRATIKTQKKTQKRINTVLLDRRGPRKTHQKVTSQVTKKCSDPRRSHGVGLNRPRQGKFRGEHWFA